MRYCTRCVLPDTRPNLVLDHQGVCNACRAHATKPDIDWPARRKAFENVVALAKSRSRGYDCLIPVSGGKDSHWQVITCLEHGLNPLAVTWRTPGRTPVGTRNLDNLKSLGVDHIDYQINPKVERAFMYQTLARQGSTAIPMHLALFNIPLKIALRFDIPLVVWGENAAFEYGTASEELTGYKLDAEWLRVHGVTHGTVAADWLGPELSPKDLTPYFGPTQEELESGGTLAIFLGYYFPWDPEAVLQTALARGFTPNAGGPRTGYYDYADIDDDFISIHHFLKWHKFGFTRTFDNLSLEIRNGRMSRDEAIDIIRARGDETPHDDIAKLCDFLKITPGHFLELCERFRNPAIWKRCNGTWVIEDFLIHDWKWL